MKKAVVIIPTYNESENISKLLPVLLDIFKTIPKWDMHVLVVDDSSPDGTAEVVRRVGAKNKQAHLLSNGKKQGLGHAYLVGMSEAFTTLGADVAFEMDADFSHDPKKIPEFIQAVDDGADMVLGSRYIPGGSIPEDWGWNRKFLSEVGNWINKVVFWDFSVHDWTGGYRAIRKEVYAAVESEMHDARFSGYTFQIGFLRKAIQKRFKVTEIPIQFIDRKIGQSKLGSDYIKNALLYILEARFQEIIQSHVFKFALVGGIGFVITTLGTFIFPKFAFTVAASSYLRLHTGLFFFNVSAVATALATECAIVSNFILNNFFTFTDRKLRAVEIVPKFLQFNFTSLAALIISTVIVGAGTHFTGDQTLSKLFWLVFATAIVMVVNYVIYSKLIWKSPPRRSAEEAER